MTRPTRPRASALRHASQIACLIAGVLPPHAAIAAEWPCEPIQAGEMTLSALAAGSAFPFTALGHAGVDWTYGVSPTLEVAVQARLLTIGSGLATIDPWRFNFVEGGVGLRWFPIGSQKLWYVAPTLRGGQFGSATMGGLGLETGLEARLGRHLLAAVALESAYFLQPNGPNSSLQVGAQTRFGYRF